MAGRSWKPAAAVPGRGTHHPRDRTPVLQHDLLGDAEYHHGCGVHDADEDPGEPRGRIGEVSPIIGKVPRTPGRWHFTMGLARSAWVFVRPAPFLRVAKSRCRHQPRCRVTLRTS